MADELWDDIIAAAGDRYNLASEGFHEFRIEEAEAKTFNSGNPGIVVKLKVAYGPEAGKSVKPVNVVRTPKAAGLFIDHLNAVGISIDTLREAKPTLAQIAAVMPGKLVRGKVKHSEYQGRPQAEIEWNMRPPEDGADPVTEFPEIDEAGALGYGDNAAVAETDDAAF